MLSCHCVTVEETMPARLVSCYNACMIAWLKTGGTYTLSTLMSVLWCSSPCWASCSFSLLICSASSGFRSNSAGNSLIQYLTVQYGEERRGLQGQKGRTGEVSVVISVSEPESVEIIYLHGDHIPTMARKSMWTLWNYLDFWINCHQIWSDLHLSHNDGQT